MNEIFSTEWTPEVIEFVRILQKHTIVKNNKDALYFIADAVKNSGCGLTDACRFIACVLQEEVPHPNIEFPLLPNEPVGHWKKIVEARSKRDDDLGVSLSKQIKKQAFDGNYRDVFFDTLKMHNKDTYVYGVDAIANYVGWFKVYIAIKNLDIDKPQTFPNSHQEDTNTIEEDSQIPPSTDPSSESHMDVTESPKKRRGKPIMKFPKDDHTKCLGFYPNADIAVKENQGQCNRSGINKVCNGKQPSCGDYWWRYATSDEITKYMSNNKNQTQKYEHTN